MAIYKSIGLKALPEECLSTQIQKMTLEYIPVKYRRR
jgi:hypothetical protein